MLFGKKVTLRGWRDNDLDVLKVLRNDITLQEMLMTQPRPNSMERVRKWLSDKSNRDDSLFFVVANALDDAPIGYVQLINMNLLHGSGDLGICLAPTAHGKGYGREVLSLLEPYLQRTFSLRKILLHVLAHNEGAIAFYSHRGFEKVGCLRSHFYLDGIYRDVLIMEKFLI